MSHDGGTAVLNNDEVKVPRSIAHSVPHSVSLGGESPVAGPSHKVMTGSMLEYPDSKQWTQARETGSSMRRSSVDATAITGVESKDTWRPPPRTTRYTLKVRQQPERARLCSYKEENDTIDRRPVDPPPVVEMRSDSVELNDLLESTSFFMRASLVQAQSETLAADYSPVFIPTGQDAASGDVIQTPERLKMLDGRRAALCVFAKLSVRLPGVFRLKFTLFETSDDGVSEVGSTTTEPFEVFSPKLFRGMAGSTPLTRHLAAQGLKVKLRPDATKQSVARRRGSGRTSASMAAVSVPSPAPPLDYTGRLVWRNTSQEVPSISPSPFDWGSVSRTGDDGMFPSFRAISGQMDWSPTPPPERYDPSPFPRASSSSMQLPSLNTDLQQFSLGIRDSGSRSMHTRAAIHGHSHSFLPPPLSQGLSLQNRTSSAQSDSFRLSLPYGDRAGDDGLAVLPPILALTGGSSSPHFPSVPPPQSLLPAPRHSDPPGLDRRTTIHAPTPNEAMARNEPRDNPFPPH